MKTKLEQLKKDNLDAIINSDINKVIDKIRLENRLVANRLKYVTKLGLSSRNIACGSGGVGSIIVKKNSIYYQISYGVSRHNYAYVVKIGQVNKKNGVYSIELFDINN